MSWQDKFYNIILCVWTKLDLYWHFDSTSEKVIESPDIVTHTCSSMCSIR